MQRIALLLAPTLVALSSPARAQVPSPPGGHVALEHDAWSARIPWRTQDGRYASGVHASLMPDGRVALVGLVRDDPDPDSGAPTESAVFTMTPTPLGQPLPAEVVVALEDVPLDADELFVDPWLVNDDLFCSGNAHMADGSLMHAGGTRAWYEITSGAVIVTGTSYAMNLGGAGWARVPGDLVGQGELEFPARWYPSLTRLPDGRMLALSGYDLVFPFGSPNLSAEVYDPQAASWQLVSPHPSVPAQVFNSDYTHPFVLPASVPGDVLMFGEAGVPVRLQLGAVTVWTVGAHGRPDTQPGQSPNYGASSVLLPLRANDGEWGYSNGSVLVAGGSHGTNHMLNADVYDPLADGWFERIPIGAPRHHPTTVLLPDGRVLLLAGHNLVGNDATQRASTLDPANGFARRDGRSKSGVVRGYHAVSLLLPDGRVLVGGGRDNETGTSGEKADFQYYSPGYMFAPRPTILGAPSQLGYDQEFALSSAGRAPKGAVLVSLGSMTHSMDFDQRHVELPLVATTGAAGVHLSSFQTPGDAALAPPGHYMLFVLDEKRAPSQARMVVIG